MFCPVSIIESEGTRKGWHWDTQFDGLCDDVTPSSLTLGHGVLEEGVQQEVAQFRLFVEGFLDFTKEATAEMVGNNMEIRTIFG